MPKEVENLIEIARIKQRCKQNNISKLAQRNENLVCYFKRNKFNTDLVPELIKKYGTRIKFSQSMDSYITLKLTQLDDKTVIREIKEYINNI